MIKGWSAQALNQEPNSTNEIHGDDLAQQYGFTGGLVPGVTVSAYLLHPAIEAWGADFLARGRAHVTVHSPLYDGEQFQVDITEQEQARYKASLRRPDDTLAASASTDLHDATPPARRGDPMAAADFVAPDACRDVWQKLQRTGCLAFPFHWHPEHIMATYLSNPAGMPALLQGNRAYANMAFILGISNWTADSNVHMNPWIHLETWSQNYRPIPMGTRIVCEMTVEDLFDKKGHEFFDANFNLFDTQDDSALTSIRLRAIYKLRAV